MEFDLEEKLAIVKMIDSIIYADGEVHPAEIEELNYLKERIGFDSTFIEQARNITKTLSTEILKAMPHEKKVALGEILTEMANADGLIHIKEINFIFDICNTIGIDLDLD